MPNWCEGKLKIRGKKENIINFIQNGLMIVRSSLEGGITRKLETRTEDFGTEVTIWIDNWDDNHYENIYVCDSHRNFIEKEEFIEIRRSTKNESYITILDIRGAWDIDVETLANLSNKFKVDFKLYAFERGACFNRDIEIIDGKIIKNLEITFSDYEWECIDPTIGG